MRSESPTSRSHSPSPDPNSPAFCFRSIGLPCLIHSEGLLTQPFHHISHFTIELDRDFIVFQGTEQESPSQLLQGVLVLDLASPLKIQDICLELNGTLRLSWKDLGIKDLGLTSHKTKLLSHTWPPFINAPDTLLPAGTHSYPFSYLLPGDTAETIEAIPEASIRYTLKATLNRGKLSRHLHAYKPVRIIRTVSPDVQLSRSVENLWLNKVDYQISLPESVAPFCGCLRLKMLFIPLAKGLEVGDVTVTLIETRECYILANHKGHRTERNVEEWKFQVSREDDWQTRIEDTDQDGWLVIKKLDLPRSLNQCIQSLNLHGIKVEHKIIVQVQLRNPDDHMSQLRIALPITLYISPHVFPEGHEDAATLPSSEEDAFPPGYGAHVLDQLYDDVAQVQEGQDDSGSDELYDLERPPTYNTAARSENHPRLE